MRISVLTLFPEYFASFASTSIIKRALESEKVVFETINFRDYTKDKHNNVDDTICGGGAGMLLTPQPIVDCISAIKTEQSLVVMMTPQGTTFHQQKARELVRYEHIILLCGHYEGFDERIRDYVDMEISIGDYVLTGGEVGALVVSDALIRLVDGVIKKDSHEDDSFENGLLEYPQYTRPIEFEGKCVPEVLLSGHHENIRKWRLKESLRKTLKRRPELLENKTLSKEEIQMLAKIKQEENES
ncbi:MAG: tRNA (guanosine(37)-N1)-methyltransferase TrmD [Erysipelotrichia bacterium]|nr:tRNA (guanosine(37)-N1)-methyltransferase TrmD [Erysipelotrichia bacterium]NCC54245.1 tRNA (guanosine(37)-N1)-methyltransferase TrmD [Erysipelotrichia bacterium]